MFFTQRDTEKEREREREIVTERERSVQESVTEVGTFRLGPNFFMLMSYYH